MKTEWECIDLNCTQWDGDMCRQGFCEPDILSIDSVTAKHKKHLLLDSWLITPCGRKYPLKESQCTTDIKEVTCKICIRLYKQDYNNQDVACFNKC